MPRPTTDSAAKLRLAVIGCGPIGNLHAQAIVGSAHATLIAVCDPDAARRETLAGRFGAKAYSDAREMFASEPFDAVTIATPDHLHVEVALAAIAAGCHVFCEKPLATTVAEAEQIVRAANDREVHLAVDYNRRYAFGYATARRLLDAGEIGPLENCVLRVSDRTPSAKVARGPHVIFTTLLTHHFDLMRHYGGEIERLVVHAGKAPAGSLLRNVAIALKFTSGALGTIVAGYRDGQTRTSEWLELGGATGSLVVEDMTRRVIQCGDDPDNPRIFLPNLFAAGDAFYDSLIAHAQDFFERVAGGRPPQVTGLDGLIGMRLAAAAMESLTQGKSIEVHDS